MGSSSECRSNIPDVRCLRLIYSASGISAGQRLVGSIISTVLYKFIEYTANGFVIRSFSEIDSILSLYVKHICLLGSRIPS